MFKKIQVLLLGVLVASPLAAFSDPIEQAKQSRKPVVVMFTKSSCPFCVWLKPRFNQLQTKSSGATFLIVDVSSNPTYYKNKYRFSAVPTVIYFNKNGQEVGRHGSNNRTIKLSQMQGYLKKAC